LVAFSFGKPASTFPENAVEHDPEKACPGLDPGGYGFSEKHVLGLDPRDHAPTIK
jgi:hypothetical protein